MSAPKLEILAHEPSRLGMLCLRRRELPHDPGVMVTEITLNHEFLMSSLNTASERALSLTALDMHEGDGLSVLVGGLGLGYTAQAALSSTRVARVEAVEFLPEVVAWLEREERSALSQHASDLNDCSAQVGEVMQPSSTDD